MDERRRRQRQGGPRRWQGTARSRKGAEKELLQWQQQKQLGVKQEQESQETKEILLILLQQIIIKVSYRHIATKT